MPDELRDTLEALRRTVPILEARDKAAADMLALLQRIERAFGGMVPASEKWRTISDDVSRVVAQANAAGIRAAPKPGPWKAERGDDLVVFGDDLVVFGARWFVARSHPGKDAREVLRDSAGVRRYFKSLAAAAQVAEDLNRKEGRT